MYDSEHVREQNEISPLSFFLPHVFSPSRLLSPRLDASSAHVSVVVRLYSAGVNGFVQHVLGS